MVSFMEVPGLFHDAYDGWMVWYGNDAYSEGWFCSAEQMNSKSSSESSIVFLPLIVIICARDHTE